MSRAKKRYRTPRIRKASEYSWRSMQASERTPSSQHPGGGFWTLAHASVSVGLHLPLALDWFDRPANLVWS